MKWLKGLWTLLFEMTDDEVKYNLIVIDTDYDNKTKEKEIYIKRATKFLGIKVWQYVRRYTGAPISFLTVEDAISHLTKLDEEYKVETNKEVFKYKLS